MNLKMKFLPAIGRLAVFAGVFVALASCAVNPNRYIPTELGASRDYIEKISLEGNLSIVRSHDGNVEASSLRYEWDQSTDKVEVTAYTLFGQVIAKITQGNDGASLQLSREKLFYASNLEQLMREHLRWSLPINQLKAWMQGFEITDKHVLRPISSANAILTTTEGWVVRFAKWEPRAKNFRPQRIEISKQYLDGRNLLLIITIAEWD